MKSLILDLGVEKKNNKKHAHIISEAEAHLI